MNRAVRIAIVGRPNVGKSSLFNRIAGSRRAIVEAKSGTTRDRLYADIKRKGKSWTLIDTGGFEADKGSDINALVLKQLDRAIEEADVIFFVTDARSGVTHQDGDLASRLRKTSKKIYLIVNKVDGKTSEPAALDFFDLGLGEPYAVSAINGSGIDELLDELAENTDKAPSPGRHEFINVAIVGRPNVGKSSYLNAILNEERAIVHSIAGTTRDAIDTDFEYNGKSYRLIDTAGMRHNMKLKAAADFYGGVRSREAIKRSDVAIVLIDGMDGFREDDERIIGLCAEEGKALMVAVNKWDLAGNVPESRYREMLIEKMNAIRNFPVIFTSCKTKKNIVPSLELIYPLYEKNERVFNSSELEEALKKLNGSPEIRNRRLKFEYLKQKGRTPPDFVLGIKNPDLANANLKRYTENFLRKAYDFEGVSLRLKFEKSR
ncbi:MAG: ribosome biogenesis GTPase Der [Candidatus Omnitrophota bacterium]|nr:ribosome biogenesis GTPase Der [Candidatus Omnitrophota bacterium]